MHPTDKAARTAGALYLALTLIAPFAILIIPNKLIVRGNATATAANILSSELLFRTGIVLDLLSTVVFIFLTLALYRLLQEVGKTHAVTMAVLALISAGISFVNAINNLAALLLFRGQDFLTVLDKPQRDALGMLFLRLHGQGIVINEIFWGLWLFPFGVLVMRSRFLPKFLGVLLIINCFAYVAISVTTLLFPPYAATVDKVLFVPMAAGELLTMLWLLIMGAKVQPEPAFA